MSLQILSLKLDEITAADYLTWCRDPARQPDREHQEELVVPVVPRR